MTRFWSDGKGEGTISKSWREQLTEIGGYENELIGVPAGSVRKIIQELEDCREENKILGERVAGLEQAVREYVREAKVITEKGL